MYITRKEVVNLLKDNITNTEDKIKNIRSEFGDVNLIFDILKIFMMNTKYQISQTNIEEINEYLAVASDEDRNGYLKQLERANNRIAEIYGINNDDFNKLYKKIIQK